MMLIVLELILLAPGLLAYPTVYGTKRYGRSSLHHQYQPRRHPINYYELYPYYSQSYPEEYYYPQEYPLYYPARTSKYEVYQAVLPYYYGDRPAPNYGFYDDVQTDLAQEVEREEREDAQPIGHEIYETDQGDDDIDDVNAAFLHNLIMSQMYKDALDQNQNRNGYYNSDDEVYGKWEDQIPDTKPRYQQEDEDVRELKQLAKPKAKSRNNKNKNGGNDNNNKKFEENIHWFERSNFRNQNNNNNNEEKRSERKEIIKTTIPPKREVRGQKEEVLMRPATPVRHPFSEPVLNMMKHDNDNRKRTPSVYDQIKHMLDVEKSLEKKYGDEIRPHMKKRIISSDESLTQQLTVLKKAH